MSSLIDQRPCRARCCSEAPVDETQRAPRVSRRSSRQPCRLRWSGSPQGRHRSLVFVCGWSAGLEVGKDARIDQHATEVGVVGLAGGLDRLGDGVDRTVILPGTGCGQAGDAVAVEVDDEDLCFGSPGSEALGGEIWLHQRCPGPVDVLKTQPLGGLGEDPFGIRTGLPFGAHQRRQFRLPSGHHLIGRHGDIRKVERITGGPLREVHGVGVRPLRAQIRPHDGNLLLPDVGQAGVSGRCVTVVEERDDTMTLHGFLDLSLMTGGVGAVIEDDHPHLVPVQPSFLVDPPDPDLGPFDHGEQHRPDRPAVGSNGGDDRGTPTGRQFALPSVASRRLSASRRRS